MRTKFLGKKVGKTPTGFKVYRYAKGPFTNKKLKRFSITHTVLN